jgi:hypothetical protein
MLPKARDDFGGLKPVLAWNVQMCDYGSYCCREVGDRTNCCNNATAPKVDTDAIGKFKFETSTAGISTTTSSSSATAAAISTSSPTNEPTQVAGTAVSTGVPFTPSLSPSAASLCAAERRKTATVGGAVGGILGAALIVACIAMFWLYKREKHQRKIKEHYEAQFEVSSAYWPRPHTIVEADSGIILEKEAESVITGDENECEHGNA